MELGPSYILAVIKAASSSDVNTQSAASRLPAPPILPRSTASFNPAPQTGRRIGAGSDPIEYDDRRRQVKMLKPLFPKRPHPTQPLIPRLPYWEPPIFNYSLQFDFYDKAQKKFKEMANGNQDELTWKTNYLDNITEWELLQMHLTWAKQAREELHNLGGMEEERKFMRGLTHALREDRKDVVSISPGRMRPLAKQGRWKRRCVTCSMS